MMLLLFCYHILNKQIDVLGVLLQLSLQNSVQKDINAENAQ